MARLPQPGGDAGHWGDVLNDFLAQEHNPDGTLKRAAEIAAKADQSSVDAITPQQPTGVIVGGESGAPVEVPGVFNVRSCGATGDGTTDDTVALNAIFANIRNRTWKRPGAVFFPRGTYRLTAPLQVDLAQIALIGEERNQSVLRQDTANTPILYWSNDLSGGAHSIRVAHLGLTFGTAATTTTTNQYGIQFRASADGALASGNGFYRSTFEDLLISGAYVGIGQWTSGNGTCPIWSCAFRNLTRGKTIHHAIKIYNDGTIGQPHNTLSHIDVLNSGATNDAEAVKGIACTGLVIDHLNVEDWNNELLSFSGGSYVTINGLRTERWRLTRNGGFNGCYFATGQFVVNGADFGRLYVQHTSGSARLIRADGGAMVTVNSVVATRDATGSTSSGTTTIFWAPTGTQVYADGISPATGTNGYLASAFGDGQYGLVRYNGAPPVWDALPTASATYRGRLAQTQGAAGVADRVVVCAKDATDACVWKDLF